MPFAWDKKQVEQPKQTKEEIEAMFNKWDNVKFKK